MRPRLAGAWQTTMADLALILFIVAVAGMQGGKESKESKQEPRPSPRGEAVAVYRAGEGAPPVSEWLAEQAPDERQQLTIVARYRPGEADAAAREALAVAEDAGAMGRSARIVLEQGEAEGTLAILAFDHPLGAVARSLQGSGKTDAAR